MYTLRFTPQSIKDLKKIPKNNQKRIISKLKFYISQNYPCLFAKRLTNCKLGQYRFRIGNYRVTFDVKENNKLYILRIGHRKKIYKC